MKVAVIGAGPAGLTAALHLVQGGAEVCVFESGPYVGGLSRSIELWGHRVDIGPHRFLSADAKVNGFWLDIVGDQYQMVDRLTRVYFRDRLIEYPIRPLEAMRKLGPLEAVMSLTSYLRQKTIPTTDDQSFESWVTRRFGCRLFELFFRSYSEKLWGIPCGDLCSDFASQRIRGFSLGAAVRNAIVKGQSSDEKTLADRFAYPVAGTGAVYETIARRFCDLGGQLSLQSSVERILRGETRVTGVRLVSGEDHLFDQVISTMPITKLIDGMKCDDIGVPMEVCKAASELEFRNTILIYLLIEGADIFDDQWLYLQAPELKAGRVTNFRNFVPQLYGEQKTTVLAVENWCDLDDATWKLEDPQLAQRAESELRSIGLLKQENVLDHHVIRISNSYPIYRKGYREWLGEISAFLSKINGLSVIGRYGAFKYNNQDHSILMGMLAAENILHGAAHDLWSVNSDFDRYQEQSVITETGLERI